MTPPSTPTTSTVDLEATSAHGAPQAFPCPVVELRQYTLHPGRRDDLVELFEREFVESQEALGMRLLGQFRDLDAPDRFVWLRGFSGMPARRTALEAFYGGPVWTAHRDRANATMVDSDNVLLLRPAWDGAGLTGTGHRAAPGASALPPGLVDITVYPLSDAPDQALLAFCRERMSGLLRQAGVGTLAWYVTEDAENTFPRLPVRTGEHVLASVALFHDLAQHDAFLGDKSWDRLVMPTLEPRLAGTPQCMRLVPTPRSRLHA